MGIQAAELKVGVGKFIYGQGCLNKLNKEIKCFGSRALILCGQTYADGVKKQIDCLLDSSIHVVTIVHNDVCSRNWAQKYSFIATEKRIDVIVGVGGGKVLDLAKATAEYSKLPIITIPTSIATCAASAAVAIMYTDEGKPDGSIVLSKEIDIVIADTQIIIKAPLRLLVAGILDSLAKYPEVIHNLGLNYSREKSICIANSKEIFSFLNGEINRIDDGKLNCAEMNDFIITNLIHTSVVSGFSLGANQLALAHALYSYMRTYYVENSTKYLHGEIVATGVLLQMDYNAKGHDSNDMTRIKNFMETHRVPCYLKDLGISCTQDSLEHIHSYLIAETNIGSTQDKEYLWEALNRRR